MSETLSEHIRNRIRNRIQEAFEKARQQPVDSHMPHKSKPVTQAADLSTKQSHYSQDQFIEETNAILEQAMQLPLPHVMLHKQHSYYVGDLNKQPRAEDLFAEALQPAKTETKRKRSS